MPEFARILIHIIKCNDCKAHPEMDKLLSSYDYFSNEEDSGFSITARESLKQRISIITAHMHSYV
jgi:hypothetical protein